MKRNLGTIVFACLATTHLASSCFSDEPAGEDPVSWNVAFSPISASNSNETLVLMVITNDDSFRTRDADTARPLWCSGMIESAYQKALQTRPDLKGKVIFQSRAAGLPKELTGNQNRNQPSRAIVAICDSGYRLLSIGVGVPDVDGILTLIEDAQNVATLRQMHPSSQKTLINALSEQSHKRLTRTWGTALSQMQDIITSGEEAPEDSGASNDQAMIRQLGRIGETLEGAYLADVRLRFSLSDLSDHVRLAVLEQHTETRQRWCVAILPFIVATDFTVMWRPITELVWKVAPVVDEISDRDFSQDEFFQWWDSHAESDMVILALQPPILTRMQPWPPVGVDSAAQRKGVGWPQLQKLVVQKPFRHVDTQELANLMRQRELQSIDIQRPSRARYLMYEPGSSRLVVIGEGELPAKYIGRIKRSL
ncbi:MAG: hypothetical protein HKN47_17810 [Pirellulaceae bacterium]|nr:hypothetical protein [Pirellulaceae bacterium]